MVKEITTIEEFNKVIKSETLVIVDFWAEWCMPCKMFSKVLSTVADSGDFGDVTFVKVNVDNAADLASAQGVRSLPTIRAFKSGEKVDEKVGSMDKANFIKMLESNK